MEATFAQLKESTDEWRNWLKRILTCLPHQFICVMQRKMPLWNTVQFRWLHSTGWPATFLTLILPQEAPKASTLILSLLIYRRTLFTTEAECPTFMPRIKPTTHDRESLEIATKVRHRLSLYGDKLNSFSKDLEFHLGATMHESLYRHKENGEWTGIQDRFPLFRKWLA